MSTVNGPVAITVPRDRNSELEPRIVPKRSRRVGQIDELVLSCYARGMSTRDIEAHLLEVYGVTASREMVLNVTDVVTDEIETWRNRPVDERRFLLVVANRGDGGCRSEIRAEQDARVGQGAVFPADTGRLFGG